jgi:ATP-binding cassette subfamily B protein
MSEPSTSTLVTLLSKVPALSGLSAERINWLASRARIYHCNVGQELLLPDRLPEHWFCLIDGRGRLLHNDPALRRPVTLAYARAGDLLGWAGLLRRSPCEWLTAATPLKLLGFEAETFYELEKKSEAFSRSPQC